VADWFWCTACRTAYMLLTKPVDNSPACGGHNGEVVFQEQMKQDHRAEAQFNIDRETRRPAKRRRSAL